MSDLLRLVAEAVALAGGGRDCRVLGHHWVHHGGMWCGCKGRVPDGGKWSGSCSIPVYRCAGCGDYDYGVNGEAVDIRLRCAQAEDLLDGREHNEAPHG